MEPATLGLSVNFETVPVCKHHAMNTWGRGHVMPCILTINTRMRWASCFCCIIPKGPQHPLDRRLCEPTEDVYDMGKGQPLALLRLGIPALSHVAHSFGTKLLWLLSELWRLNMPAKYDYQYTMQQICWNLMKHAGDSISPSEFGKSSFLFS